MLKSGFSSQSGGGELGKLDGFWEGLDCEPCEDAVEGLAGLPGLGESGVLCKLLLGSVDLKRRE